MNPDHPRLSKTSGIPHSPAESAVQLRLFGTTELHGPESAQALLAQPKRMALLAYLCAETPRGYHRRDRLVGMFWPEHSQEHARTALRKAVWAIRKGIGDLAILSRGDEEVCANDALIWCDVAAFNEARDAGHTARAIELYRGPLLNGFFADASGFEQWADAERNTYRDLAVGCAWRLAEQFEGGADFTSAARWARKAAKLAAISDERLLRRTLQLLDRAGDKAGAVELFREFERSLKREYAIAPSQETLALVRSITAR